MLISTDPTPFLSQNRDRPKGAARAVSGTVLGLGVRCDGGGVGVGGEGVVVGLSGSHYRSKRASTGHIKGRKSAPLLLSLPPPTAPPTGPLPMLPTGVALAVGSMRR